MRFGGALLPAQRAGAGNFPRWQQLCWDTRTGSCRSGSVPFASACSGNVGSQEAARVWGGEIVVASMSGCGVFSLQAGDGPGLVGSVAHNLQSACASGISSVKKVPAVAWDAAEGLILFTPRRLSRAMETVDALGGTLVSAPKHLLGTLYSYVPVSL